MKMIVFGDIHEDKENAARIDGIDDADYVIITGDFTNRGGADTAGEIIEFISRRNPRIYAQAGNFDQKEVNDYLDELGINLHANGFDLKGVGIFGVGGSNQTPFNTPIEYTEEAIEDYIQRGYEKIKHLPLKIMVSHTPPYETAVDVVGGGAHVGSTAVRKFIETYEPQLCLTGHIHEAAGIDRIGKTIILNPGMLKDGGYIEVIENKGELEASLKKI